jgi:hypothetical protein
MPFDNAKPKDIKGSKLASRMALDPANLSSLFGAKWFSADEEEQPQPPTAAMLAEAAQKERKRIGKKQGYLSTVLSMGSPLNNTGPKSLLGG